MSEENNARAAEKPSSEPFLSFLYLPAADINYNFITLVYAVASVVCIGLYVLDVVLKVCKHSLCVCMRVCIDTCTHAQRNSRNSTLLVFIVHR